jgi:hypothetical protein
LALADAKTADDATATGFGGSIPFTDPVSASPHTWWLSSAQAKALGLVADNLNNDVTTTFGAGFSYTFSGPIAPGTFDFQATAAHEISEVMGRLGLMGVTIGSAIHSYSLDDLFTFSGSGSRNLTCPSNNNWFSINNGNTLLKQENDYCTNGLDPQDWASGTPDSFNQFATLGASEPVTSLDLRDMDVLGYDRIFATTTPEPSTLILLASGLVAVVAPRFRKRTLAS